LIKTSERHFIYNFKIQDTIEYANLFSDEMLARTEVHIVTVIYQSFVIPADEDYLTARLLFKANLYRGFYWSAAQCIEKYLKAFLLIHGISVKEKNHSINHLIEEAIKIDNKFEKIDFKIHPAINIDKNLYGQINILSLQSFLKDIENYGSADNRYNTSGVDFGIEHLFALDKFVFLLRGQIEVPDISDSFKQFDSNTKSAFEVYNPWFCKDDSQNHVMFPNKDFPTPWSWNSPWLNVLKKNHEHPERSLALKWLNEKMKLPKEVSQLITSKKKVTLKTHDKSVVK